MSAAPQRDKLTAVRGAVLTFTGDPFLEDSARSMRCESDAIVAMRGGLVVDFGAAADVLARLPPETKVTAYEDSLIMAGFIDAHVHYPQTAIIASPADDVMEWLDRHTYVAEQRSPIRTMRGRPPGSSSAKPCVRERRPRRCSARSIPGRSTRCSRRRSRATCG